MIYALGAEEFVTLATDELCCGFHNHLELQFSNKNEDPESHISVHGPTTIAFKTSRKKAGHIRLWVPIK